MDFLQSLEQTLSRFVPDLQQADFIVGYSGGMDSTVLLDAMCQLRDAGRLKKLRAIHVHHGLSQQADAWGQHCESFCAKRSIPFEIRQISLPEHCPDGVELAARDARYQVFESVVNENTVLLQAHHQQDQAETFLFRALRGSGINGLSGIPQSRSLGNGLILRPFLKHSLESLKSQAELRKLIWIEDDSNTDDRFDRNFLRLNILPLLETRWPGARKKLAEAADNCAEASELLQRQLINEYEAVAESAKGLFLQNVTALACDRLQCMSLVKQRQLIRYWLGRQNFMMPSRIVLERIIQEVIPARDDAEPEVCWPGASIRRYKGQLIAVEPFLEVTGCSQIWIPFENKELDLNGNGTLACSGNVPSDMELVIRYRDELQDSGKFALAGRSGRKTLKRWLQESGVPPWLRGRLPIVCYQGQILAVPDIGVSVDAPLEFRVCWLASRCQPCIT
ncbi:tRNA lysidine(34) synthetase TilS [Endozoicomonadaceae bacterium StTr2]